MANGLDNETIIKSAALIAAAVALAGNKEIKIPNDPKGIVLLAAQIVAQTSAQKYLP